MPAGPAFAAVFKHGRRSKDDLFLVCATPNAQTYARLGVNVGRRVSTKAVLRNRIKRQVRETFRRHQAEAVSLDVVVVAQVGAVAADNIMLRNSLREHLIKVAQKCKKS